MGAGEWTDEPAWGRSDGPCDDPAAGGEAGLGTRPHWRSRVEGGRELRLSVLTSPAGGGQEQKMCALAQGSLMEQPSHQPRRLPSACAGPEPTRGASPGAPWPPSCPHPRPQGPGGPHSPVFHDAAHVVDGAVAQVGAQEVAHQLGRNTLPSDRQTRAPGLTRPHPAGLHAQLLSAISSQMWVPKFALKMPPSPGLHSATGKVHCLPSAHHCLGAPGVRGHSLHTNGPCPVLRLTHHLPWEAPVGRQGRPYLPARFTELLDVDGAAESDDE